MGGSASSLTGVLIRRRDWAQTHTEAGPHGNREEHVRTRRGEASGGARRVDRHRHLGLPASSSEDVPAARAGQPAAPCDDALADDTATLKPKFRQTRQVTKSWAVKRTGSKRCSDRCVEWGGGRTERRATGLRLGELGCDGAGGPLKSASVPGGERLTQGDRTSREASRPCQTQKR